MQEFLQLNYTRYNMMQLNDALEYCFILKYQQSPKTGLGEHLKNHQDLGF